LFTIVNTLLERRAESAVDDEDEGRAPGKASQATIRAARLGGCFRPGKQWSDLPLETPGFAWHAAACRRRLQRIVVL
jgi:hypothetical protein